MILFYYYAPHSYRRRRSPAVIGRDSFVFFEIDKLRSREVESLSGFDCLIVCDWLIKLSDFPIRI